MSSPRASSYSLKGATVRIHTGHGTARAGHLYLGSGRPIWNNDGDTGTIIDSHNVDGSGLPGDDPGDGGSSESRCWRLGRGAA
jgi:hypothetical protein